MNMVKKYLYVFIIILLFVAFYSIFQKNNPSVKKIFNMSFDEKNQQTGSVSQPNKTVSKTIFLEIDQQINNTTVASEFLSFTGKTIPDGSVFVNEKELKADAKGNFSASISLYEGQNDIYVVASDDFGNSVEKDFTVNLELTQ